MWNDKWEWNGLSVWSFNTFPHRWLTHILACGSPLSFYKRPTSTQEVASADICENNYNSTALIYRFCRHFSVLFLRCFSVCKKKKEKKKQFHEKDKPFMSHAVKWKNTVDLGLNILGRTNWKMLKAICHPHPHIVSNHMTLLWAKWQT